MKGLAKLLVVGMLLAQTAFVTSAQVQIVENSEMYAECGGGCPLPLPPTPDDDVSDTPVE